MHNNGLVNKEWKLMTGKFAEWIQLEWGETHSSSLNEPVFRVASNTEYPHQGATLDCGAYVCRTMEALATGCPFDFARENMPFLRILMVEEVATQKLHRNVSGLHYL